MDAESRPIQILHDDVWVALDRIEIIDLHDIRMAESRNHPRFPLEALAQIVVLFDVAVQDFNGNRAIEGEVRAKIDLCHTPVCKQLVYADFADGLSYPLRHACIINLKLIKCI